jgi:ribosomal protein S18 acetylase RimI-like enzyme
VQIPLIVRALEPEDLPGLDWTGGPEHQRAIADDLQRSSSGGLHQLVVALPNGQLVGFGGVDFRRSADAGTIWMLSVHPLLQSIGIGTTLIRALEERIVAHGRSIAEIGVEHDNPSARRLYERLGYRECGSALDEWPAGGGGIYVTVCTVLRRALP